MFNGCFKLSGFLGEVDECSDSNGEVKTDNGNETMLIPKFNISRDQLILMQNSNYALKNVNNIISKGVLPKLWNVPSLS